MKIKVIDAFGTHVGDAEVTWRDDIGYVEGGPQSMQEEIKLIFPPETTVILPTVNVQVPWRLEVTP